LSALKAWTPGPVVEQPPFVVSHTHPITGMFVLGRFDEFSTALRFFADELGKVPRRPLALTSDERELLKDEATALEYARSNPADVEQILSEVIDHEEYRRPAPVKKCPPVCLSVSTPVGKRGLRRELRTSRIPHLCDCAKRAKPSEAAHG
jgi:hypothetical protein